MKLTLITRLHLATGGLLLFLFITTVAQPASASLQQSPVKGLFDADEVMQVTLKGNLRNLLNDRTNIPKNNSLVLSYKENSTEISLPVEVKTRGHFRRLKENCLYPPLLIQFSKQGAQPSSVFKQQKKLKLVMPCRGDEYIVREWMVYKLYNLVTPKSFKARLVQVTLEDDKNKKPVTPFYGILLEEEKQMAKRNKLVSVVRKIKPEQTQPDAFLNMAVFEYLIGNTDWSVQYLQNIKLLAKDFSAVPVTVPYDFDHAGIVSTPYAQPAEELQMSSVRQRRYRGYCVKNMKVFEDIITRYNQLKNDIYSLYTNCTLVDSKYI